MIVSITTDDQTRSEDVGSVEVCVTLDHAPSVPVLVTVSTEDGTAQGMHTLHLNFQFYIALMNLL